MKNWLFLTFIIAGCNAGDQATTENKTDTLVTTDTVISEKKHDAPVLSDSASNDPITPQPAKVYSNQRFKEVRVLNTGQNQFLVQGKGQIFEASFNWIVEDGHEEIKKGYATTDAGAPEWGNFKFNLEVEKKRPNSKLTLVLFESSAKDGSRQYELPIPLN